MSELTPREWQDIEKAKPALRIDSGWADLPDVASAISTRDASTGATGGAAPTAAEVAYEPSAVAARSFDSPPTTPATSSTPESLGLPTAG